MSDPADTPRLLAFGDSLTAGYGLPTRDAFPAQLQNLLRASRPGAVVQNSGVSGDTSASGLARLPRLLSSLRIRPDLAIVELGANDLLRGMSLQESRRNLDAILAEFARCGIPVLLAAMEAPRLLGSYALACDALYVELAAAHGVPSWPFLPPGVIGNRAFTLPDRIHPNAAGVARIAARALAPVADALSAA